MRIPGQHVFLLALMSVTIPCLSQTKAIIGAVDQSIPMPPVPHSVSRVDASAVQELSAYQAAVGEPWLDLVGSGIVTYPSATGDLTGTATLYLMGAESYRLDFDTGGERASLRVGKHTSSSQHEGKRSHPLSMKEARAGIVAFPHLIPSITQASGVSLIDQGNVTTELGTLHRITFERPLDPQPADGTPQKPIEPAAAIITDLYFDTNTHLLSKSSYSFSATGGSKDDVQVIVTYGGYQQVNHSYFPSILSQTVNGQKTWTITLKTIQLSQGLTDSTFTQQ